MSKKNLNILPRTGDMTLLAWYQEMSKATNTPTDIQNFWNYSEIVFKHPKNATTNLRKIYHPEYEVSQPNFSKEVRQDTA